MSEAEVIEEETKVESIDSEEIDENQPSDIELRAIDQGWTPKDDFKGDPDNWKPAKQFVEYGDLRSRLDTMNTQMRTIKKSHEEQITGLNIYHKADTDRQLTDLTAKINKAAEDGETEEVTNLIEQRDSLVEQKANLNVSRETNPQDAAILQGEWELDNQWVFDTSDPRAAIAHSAFQLAGAKGLSMTESLAFVEDKVSGVKIQKVNPNRQLPGDTTNSSGQRKGEKTRKLTMADLTPKELAMRAAFPDGEKGDEQFLKSAQNSRTGV